AVPDVGVVVAAIPDLYAGQLWVAVSGADAGQEARIADALATLHGQLSGYGVSLVEVTGASAAYADINVHVADTSAIGGVADGVLGVTTVGREITPIARWN